MWRPLRDSAPVCCTRSACVGSMNAWRKASPVRWHTGSRVIFWYIMYKIFECWVKVFFFIVYRQGDIGTSWYAVLSGSLDVKVSETSNYQVRQIDGEKAHNEVLLNCSEIRCVRQKLVLWQDFTTFDSTMCSGFIFPHNRLLSFGHMVVFPFCVTQFKRTSAHYQWQRIVASTSWCLCYWRKWSLEFCLEHI